MSKRKNERISIKTSKEDMRPLLEYSNHNKWLNFEFCRIFENELVGQVLVYLGQDEDKKGNKIPDCYTLMLKMLDQNGDCVVTDLNRRLENGKPLQFVQAQMLLKAIPQSVIDSVVPEVIHWSILHDGDAAFYHKKILISQLKDELGIEKCNVIEQVKDLLAGMMKDIEKNYSGITFEEMEDIKKELKEHLMGTKH